MLVEIIYISFIFKSKGAVLKFFKKIPKVTLNQHLEKPIKPITLVIKNNKKVKIGDILNSEQNK